MPVVFRTDGREFKALGNLYAAAGSQGPRAVRLAVREVGMKARTRMRGAVKQELAAGHHRIAMRINRRITSKVVSLGALAEYHIEAKGRIALKHFRTVQSGGGVAVPGVKKEYIDGVADLRRAFEGTTGHAGTRGNRIKRRATLGGRIVVDSRGMRRGKGEGRGSRLRTVAGVNVPKAFLSRKSRTEFESEARRLPKVLSRILFAAISGKLRSHRGAWR